MNVDTLLEAAKFLEEQEEKAKQQRQEPQQVIRKVASPVLDDFRNNRIAPLQQQQQLNHIRYQNQQQQANPHQQQQQQQAQLNNHFVNNNTAKSLLLDQSNQNLRVTPPPIAAAPPPRVIKNSFDIINRLVIDESGEQKRKPPPIVFRSGTREVHNKLEKDRRAHLKECFDLLKKQLPKAQDERKSSNLSILHSAIRYINSLKKRERDLEHEMEQLARQKIAYQQKMAVLKRDLGAALEGMDFSDLFCAEPPLAARSGSSQSAASSDDLEGSRSPSESKMDTSSEEAIIYADEVGGSRFVNGMNVARTLQQINGIKENTPVQATALSVVPLPYPMSQMVLQKVALVPKSLSDLSPLVPNQTTVAHLITASPHQQLGGKVLPAIVNAQYVVKPVVVVSTPSRPPS